MHHVVFMDWDLSGTQRRRPHRLYPGLCDRLALRAFRELQVMGCPYGKNTPPDVVVCDGRTGFEKVRKRIWPTTRVQRCAFHAFCQVRAQTTSHPKLQAGVELYGLAKELLAIKEASSALAWLEAYGAWRARWEGLLAERTLDEETGRMH